MFKDEIWLDLNLTQQKIREKVFKKVCFQKVKNEKNILYSSRKNFLLKKLIVQLFLLITQQQKMIYDWYGSSLTAKLS